MSADNWTICPKCKKRADAEKEAKRIAAAKAYGKVPADEWRRMCDEAEAEPDPELLVTLREDYQLGMTEGGEFVVAYSCSCKKCDFKHKFRHTESLKVE